MGKGSKKAQKKQHFKQNQMKGKRDSEIKDGLTGFMITCDTNKEKRVIKEMFNVLNAYVESMYNHLDFKDLKRQWNEQEAEKKAKSVAAKLAREEKANVKKYPCCCSYCDKIRKTQEHEKQEEIKEPQKKNIEQQKDESFTEKEEPGVVMVGKGLQDEIQELREKSRHLKLWFNFDIGMPGIIFIKIAEFARAHISVKALGVKIIEDTAAGIPLQQSRFACRFMPVDILCKAKLIEDFKKWAIPVITETFLSETSAQRIQWCIEFRCRNNNLHSKSDYNNIIYDLIGERHPSNYDFADQEIIIEIFRDILIFAVLPKYKHYKRYNLQQLGTPMVGEDSDGELIGTKRQQPETRVIKISDLIKQMNEPKGEGEQKEEKIEEKVDYEKIQQEQEADESMEEDKESSSDGDEPALL